MTRLTNFSSNFSTAEGTGYDNTVSGLLADNAQDAIDETNAKHFDIRNTNFDLYIDPTAGNDSNDGFSDTTPLLTFAAVTAKLEQFELREDAEIRIRVAPGTHVITESNIRFPRIAVYGTSSGEINTTIPVLVRNMQIISYPGEDYTTTKLQFNPPSPGHRLFEFFDNNYGILINNLSFELNGSNWGILVQNAKSQLQFRICKFIGGGTQGGVVVETLSGITVFSNTAEIEGTWAEVVKASNSVILFQIDLNLSGNVTRQGGLGFFFRGDYNSQFIWGGNQIVDNTFTQTGFSGTYRLTFGSQVIYSNGTDVWLPGLSVFNDSIRNDSRINSSNSDHEYSDSDGRLGLRNLTLTANTTFGAPSQQSIRNYLVSTATNYDVAFSGSTSFGKFFFLSLDKDSDPGATITITNVVGADRVLTPGNSLVVCTAGDGAYVVDPNNISAAEVTYNNTTSGLTATNAQEALDELVANTTKTKLTADTDFYVDGTLGNDSNDGLSPGAGAFQTIKGALDTLSDTYDLNSFVLTLNVAAGTYIEGVFELPQFTDSNLENTDFNQDFFLSAVDIIGDETTPSNVVIEGGIRLGNPTPYKVSGFRLELNTAAGGNNFLVFATEHSRMDASNIEWVRTDGTSFAACARGTNFANLFMGGTHSVEGVWSHFYYGQTGAIWVFNATDLNIVDIQTRSSFLRLETLTANRFRPTTLTNPLNWNGSQFSIRENALLVIGDDLHPDDTPGNPGTWNFSYSSNLEWSMGGKINMGTIYDWWLEATLTANLNMNSDLDRLRYWNRDYTVTVDRTITLPTTGVENPYKFIFKNNETSTGNLIISDGTTLATILPGEIYKIERSKAVWQVYALKSFIDKVTGTPVSTDPDGTLIIDDTLGSERLYVRVNGAWKSTPLV